MRKIAKKPLVCIAAAMCIMAANPARAEEFENLYYGEVEEMTEAPGVLTPDLSQGFPFYSNPKKAAPLGLWLKAYRMSQADAEDHIVYFRINSITDTDTTAEDIAQFNQTSSMGQIMELEDPYLEYKEINYDVYYPEDFPVNPQVVDEEGLSYIQDPTLAFSIVNPEGGGFVTDRGIYVGLSKVQPLDFGFEKVDGVKIHPGEVFHGRSVFAMLSDEKNYVLEYACRQSESDPTVIYQYSQVADE